MALRLLNKISSRISSNLYQVLQTKRTLQLAVNLFSTNNKQTDQNAKTSDDSSKKSNTPNTHPKVSDVKIIQNEVSYPELQPSLLPEFYNPNKPNNPPITVQKVVIVPKQEAPPRVFEASSTYKSVKLPLKPLRLAKPFPDPVKIMPSDTITDQEKSHQMQIDAQYPGNSKSKNTVNFRPQYRSYSTKSEKLNKKCQVDSNLNIIHPRINISFCKAVKDNCVSDVCKFEQKRKQRTPYSSFSEFCHKVVDSFSSKCQQPWIPQNLQSFRIRKRKYHTGPISFNPKRKNVGKWFHNVNRQHYPQKVYEHSETNKNLEEKISGIKKNTKTKKFKEADKFKENLPTLSKTNTGDEVMDSVLDVINIPTNRQIIQLRSLTDKDEVIESKTKNNDDIRKKRKPLPFVKIKDIVHQPKKKIKKTGKDLNVPETPSSINITINYFMSKEKNRNKPSGIKKCPDIDPVGDDPCNLKRKGITRECPKDLLIKKRRPVRPSKKKDDCSSLPKKPDEPNL